MKRLITLVLTSLPLLISAQTEKLIPYGNFESWVTRNINESHIIGGNKKTLYEIGPELTINGNTPYTPKGGSPWATSNVYAHVKTISKGSNAVFPDSNPAGGRCCKLTTILDNIKVLGIINMDVLVSGSIYLGYNIEPITSTDNPYGKMEMGIPSTDRPKTLRIDYRVEAPANGQTIRATGFSKKKYRRKG